MTQTTQSPEADLDREIETLIGEIVRGMSSPDKQMRLLELQSKRSRLMRPTRSPRRQYGYYSRSAAF